MQISRNIVNGPKSNNWFLVESGLSSASRNHLTTFCRPFAHYASHVKIVFCDSSLYPKQLLWFCLLWLISANFAKTLVWKTWIWRHIMTSQITHTQYKWHHTYATELTPHENFLRTPQINNILQTFVNSCYHHQCIANWTAMILLQLLMVSHEKSAVRMKNAKGCFGSDVVARSIRSHMTQLDTCRWWWRVASWLKHEVLLQVKNAQRHRWDVRIQLWFVFLNQSRFKNLQRPTNVVTANGLGVVKANPMIQIDLQVSADWRALLFYPIFLKTVK